MTHLSPPIPAGAKGETAAVPVMPVWIAALVSAVLPGAGQWFLGRKRQAGLFLSGTLTLAVMLWLLRPPLHYADLTWSFLGVFCFCLSSGAAVFLTNRSHEPGASKWWFLGCILLAGLSGFAYNYSIALAAGFRLFSVPSVSMEDTILPGDHILVDLHAYEHTAPASGDMIIYPREDFFVVKRVMATGGNTVEGRAGFVLVNGKRLEEPYAKRIVERPSDPWINDFGPVTVPPNQLFVMGDNRGESLDSRVPGYGTIEVASVVGRPLYVVLNLPQDPAPGMPGRSYVPGRTGKEIK